ncbi:hypothetical protein KC331_g10490 [Hortaea werneckii]|nr:hypothetical protein KC331_g10490 [Hortaea werneckii]KAI7713710.1 hypothetical protein KC353_g7349 [Hortaea werneckii]
MAASSSKTIKSSKSAALMTSRKPQPPSPNSRAPTSKSSCRGLWDCHVHLTGMHTVTGSAFISSQQNMALTGARLAKDAQLLLDAGFTSVREMAGYGIQLAAAIEEGSAVGPTIYSSNSIISPTGGHADLHTMPKAWFEDACSHGLPMRTCDGVPECLKAVREQLRTGAKVIKICGSGGVGSERE